MTLSEKIPILVKRQGISQAELARTIGTYPSRVSEWVSGTGSPNLQQALRMARALDVPLEFLVDDELSDPPTRFESDRQKFLMQIVGQIGLEQAIDILLPPTGSGRRVLTPVIVPVGPTTPERKGVG